MKSKIEITLTEKEASHLRTLLEGGVTITDSITQSEVFYGILSKLNSQSQPEEKTLEQIREEFDKERIKEWNKTAVETYKQATQDTPEDTEHIKAHKEYLATSKQDTPEEWEDRIRDLILDISADRLVSSEKVVAIVQSLLNDRERKAREDIIAEISRTKIPRKFWDRKTHLALLQWWEGELDKLNSKKK